MFVRERRNPVVCNKLRVVPTAESFPLAEHRACTTLTRLTIDHLPADRSIGRRRTFGKDSEIWRPEDRGDRIYFLERGEIAIFSGDPLARDLLLQTAHAGEPVGELCLCAEGTGQRNTLARACTDVVVFELKYEVFLRYVEAHPAALKALLCTFCVRLSESESQSQILAHRGAQERLGRLLIQLGKKTPKGKRGTSVVVHVSHREIALMAAMSRPHVSVVMGHFRRLGLVEYERGRPLSVNVEALASYVASREAAAISDVPARGGR